MLGQVTLLPGSQISLRGYYQYLKIGTLPTVVNSNDKSQPTDIVSSFFIAVYKNKLAEPWANVFCCIT
jgi:hypothetical protein